MLTTHLTPLRDKRGSVYLSRGYPYRGSANHPLEMGRSLLTGRCNGHGSRSNDKDEANNQEKAMTMAAMTMSTSRPMQRSCKMTSVLHVLLVVSLCELASKATCVVASCISIDGTICFNRGSCVNGRCQCQEGYGGSDCSMRCPTDIYLNPCSARGHCSEAGWVGPKCEFGCPGGSMNPCSGKGECRTDGFRAFCACLSNIPDSITSKSLNAIPPLPA
eukprot:766742-Hanusia_phi.AAC.4